MSTPHTGTAAEAVTIHKSATEAMRDLIGEQLEDRRIRFYKIPDDSWQEYLIELKQRLGEWAASGGELPDPRDLSSYACITAMSASERAAIDKFLAAYSAFLITKGLAGDAANKILLDVQSVLSSANTIQAEVLPLVARKVAEFRKIDAMIQPVQMIPAPANGPARAKRLILDAAELGDGWLMADGCDDMTEQLRALFWNDSFTDLMAARIPMFLNRVLTGPDAKRMGVDDAEAAGLLLTDGAAVPPVRRLRGVRLDVLRELAVYCNADDLVLMIDSDCSGGAVQAPMPSAGPESELAAVEPVRARELLPEILEYKKSHKWPEVEAKYGITRQRVKALEKKQLPNYFSGLGSR